MKKTCKGDCRAQVVITTEWDQVGRYMQMVPCVTMIVFVKFRVHFLFACVIILPCHSNLYLA